MKKKRNRLELTLNLLTPRNRLKFKFIALCQMLLGVLELSVLYVLINFASMAYSKETEVSSQTIAACLSVLFMKSLLSFFIHSYSLRYGVIVENEILEKTLVKFHDPRMISKYGSPKINQALDAGLSNLVSNFLIPISAIFSDVVILIGIILAISIYNQFFAIVMLIVFGFLGFVLMKVSRNRLDLHNQRSNELFKETFQRLDSAIRGSKTAYILRKMEKVSDWYFESREALTRSRSKVDYWGNFPRYFSEIYLFGFLIIVFTSIMFFTDTKSALETSAILLFIAMRIFPAWQRMNTQLSKIKSNTSTRDEFFEIQDFRFDDTLLKPKWKNGLISTHEFTIECKSLTKRFHSESSETIQSLNCIFTNQKLNFLIGDSGAGKSTLCEILLGLQNPTSGEVSYLTSESLDSTPKNDQPVLFNYMSQNVPLFHTSIQENVSLDLGSLHSQEPTIKALNESNLQKLVNRFSNNDYASVQALVNDISGGEKQRIGLARLRYLKGEVIICDEPENALDNENSKDLMNYLRSLVGKNIIVVVTHNLDLIGKDDHIVKLGSN